MAYTIGVEVVEFLKERKVLLPHLGRRQEEDLALEIDRRFGERIRMLGDALIRAQAPGGEFPGGTEV